MENITHRAKPHKGCTIILNAKSQTNFKIWHLIYEGLWKCIFKVKFTFEEGDPIYFHNELWHPEHPYVWAGHSQHFQSVWLCPPVVDHTLLPGFQGPPANRKYLKSVTSSTCRANVPKLSLPLLDSYLLEWF